MAKFPHDPRNRRAARALLLCALAGISAVRAAAPSGDTTLYWDAAQLLYEGNHLVLPDFRATRGTLHIRADKAEAAGLNFENSALTLSGHVQIDLPEGELLSDAATVQFVDGLVHSATASGAPAAFNAAIRTAGTGPAATSTQAHGHASQIDYDAASGDVRLRGDASLSDENKDLNSQEIHYNLATRRIQAGSPVNDGTRVHGTLRQQAPVVPPGSGTTP